MKTIELHGILAKKFGRFFKLDVKSAKEACHAIACQLPAFKQFMLESEQLGYCCHLSHGIGGNVVLNAKNPKSRMQVGSQPPSTNSALQSW